MIFDQSGSLASVSRHDYLPFGEELSAGLRSTTPGYANSDGERQKFTQKERDNETGLDYFEARYYGSSQGRFTSVDPMMMDRNRMFDPQRINAYSYTRNNPLKLIDPDGADPQDPVKVVVNRKDTTYPVQGKTYDADIKDAYERGKTQHPGAQGAEQALTKQE
jgi:RHS repeat-associated protein